MQKQAASTEVLEQAFKKSEHGGHLNTTKKGPTKSVVNSASSAMQDGVLGTWTVLCTKESVQKCTEALAAEDHAVHRITIWRGEARTYLHQIWTERPLDCPFTWIQLLCSRDHARQDERGPRGPVMQKVGACVSTGKILSTHRIFLLGFQCRVKADSHQSMYHQETVEKAGRIRHYNVAGRRLATLLRFCRHPGAVSGRSVAEVEDGDAEELWCALAFII
ncbi:hypothetical protein NDU88_005689 [Pleurodeles waltl]|uniref:Uncharacterized protein n=1 Tax=Pleurodeles waltl TaxID=8319 RepID=A0AAV7RPX3_PLEWA|nr:hypothetical protein NDU88_005689 [Pleurodeles waltl]